MRPPRRLPSALVALLLLALAPSPGDGIEVVIPEPERHSEAPTFVGGKDVFGRTPRCRACHALLTNLDEALVPKLREMRKKDMLRRRSDTSAARRVDFGKFEGLIMDVVPRGCKFSSTYHNKDLRKACETLVEKHEDAIIQKYYEWSQRPPQPGEEDGIGGGEGAAAPRVVPGMPHIPPKPGTGAGWNWNLQVCYKATEACSIELAMHRLEDFADDGSGQQDRSYRSEHRPPIGTREGEVLTVVAASFFEEVVRPEGLDVMAYFSFPQSAADVHARFNPVFQELAWILAGNGTAPVRLARVDADTNDVPPPYGNNIKTPQIALYRAGNKATPTYITQMGEGEVSLYDMLYFLLTSCGDDATRNLAAHLIQTLDYNLLYKVPDPSEEPRRSIPVEVDRKGRAKRAKPAPEPGGAEDEGVGALGEYAAGGAWGGGRGGEL